jgi:hypothetical protein
MFQLHLETSLNIKLRRGSRAGEIFFSHLLNIRPAQKADQSIFSLSPQYQGRGSLPLFLFHMRYADPISLISLVVPYVNDETT